MKNHIKGHIQTQDLTGFTNPWDTFTSVGFYIILHEIILGLCIVVTIDTS
jgi:hypothetical protein